MQSSKYVQSDLQKCYSAVKQRIKEGKTILFTGTPCQVAGLYVYLEGTNIENIYTLDLICHGVPSPKFLKKYFQYQNTRMGEPVKSYNFRFKGKKGWGNST